LNFFSTHTDYELYISGKPYCYSQNEFDGLLEKYVNKSTNIRYLGLLPLNEYYEVLNSVDIALSFRDSNDLQHDYNFPSKILEYLSFGKIVISTKKYPDIDDKLYFHTQANSESLKVTLDSIFLMSKKDLIERNTFVYNYLIESFTEKALINSIIKVSNG
jgi:glycosyltransferase involved in cell wall biosynthesis